MSELEAVFQIVGAHEFRFVPPRRVSFVMRGIFEEDHANKYTEFLATQAGRCDEALECLFDVSALKGISDRARARVVKRERPLPYCSVAIVGASFSIRTVANMMISAGKIIAPQKFSFKTKFVDSVEEANMWFDELRSGKNKV
jgi:hypothetical protein